MWYYFLMSSFSRLTGTSPGMFYGPDGSQHTEKWWDIPKTPEEHPKLAIRASFLSQVSEDEAGGRQSCALTSQLNALITRGLDPSTAADLQNKLVTDEAYARYWANLGENNYMGWTANPTTLPFILSQSGFKVGIEHIDSPDVLDTLSTRLSLGYVAVIAGVSRSGGHSRLAFEPQEIPGSLYIHDPKYPDTSGHYEYAQLPQFQTISAATVF
jgi:hypothetical protein